MCRTVRLAPLLLFALFISCPAGELQAQDDEALFTRQRAKLVQWLGFETQLAAEETGIDQLDPRVLEAIGSVPRHRFVPKELRIFSYLPQPLPVHSEQNLAAPFLAALMLHLADLHPGDVVFETGTDTGYNAASCHG